MGDPVKKKDPVLKLEYQGMRYDVQNVVVTAQIADSLNLLDITMKVPGAIYEPGKFPALRMKRENAGFLLYSSGKIVCTGTKSPEEARKRIENLRTELAGYGIKTKEPIVHVRNIVASVDLQRELKLHELAYSMDESEYNPEYFPAMKINTAGTRILLFRTGKAILPGMKSMNDVDKTAQWLKHRLEQAEEEMKKEIRKYKIKA